MTSYTTTNGVISAVDRLARWGVTGVEHALYSSWGNWFRDLKKFPGALVDPQGFVLFKTEAEYRACPGLSWGNGKGTVNCTKRIRNLPGYVRAEKGGV